VRLRRKITGSAILVAALVAPKPPEPDHPSSGQGRHYETGEWVPDAPPSGPTERTYQAGEWVDTPKTPPRPKERTYMGGGD
jgi:hypothetical protein